VTDHAHGRNVARRPAWQGLLALTVLAAFASWTLYGQEPAEKPQPSQPSTAPRPTSPVIPPAPVEPAPAPIPNPSVPQLVDLTVVQAAGQQQQRFTFVINPQTPLKELLPTPPKVERTRRPVVSDDPARVPEIVFENAAPRNLDTATVTKNTALTIARVNHLNKKETDAFIKALQSNRADLAGLPFAMGDKCRTKGDHSKQFAVAVNLVRTSMSANGDGQGGNPVPLIDIPGEPSPAAAFWERFRVNCNTEDCGLHRADCERRELVTKARIAALMQILAPEAPSIRLGLVRYLAATSHVEATRALARLALYSPEEAVRVAAVEALKVRRERDYTEVLTAGLVYPSPAVAKRATEAIVKLERTDLIPKLIEVLDAPDPRAPVVKEVDSKKVTMASELVRVNHHRSCLLCHAPGNTDDVGADTLTAGVPLSSEPLGGVGVGAYRRNIPDILVRLDVTYLRQDFSVMLPVAEANPWPEMQRYDFLVQTRALTDEEAAAYREEFGSDDTTRPNAYRRAALVALRELTGRDAAPTGEAWRKLLQK
jgi:hypothetical protein